MAIRYSRAMYEDGRLSIIAWNGNVAAGVPVGSCDCGGDAEGEPITRGRHIVWAAAGCGRCGAEAALPVVDVPETVAA